MALSGANGTGGGANYYINSGVVKSVKVDYNIVNNNNPDKVTDVQLEVVLDSIKDSGEHFDKTIWVAGNYKKQDISNQIMDWGSAFKIRQFFNVCGLTKWSTDDFGILPDYLAKDAVGQTVFTISYRSSDDAGEPKYRTYKMVAKNAEQIEKMFLKDVAGEYAPWKYEPNVEDDSFPPADDDVI